MMFLYREPFHHVNPTCIGTVQTALPKHLFAFLSGTYIDSGYFIKEMACGSNISRNHVANHLHMRTDDLPVVKSGALRECESIKEIVFALFNNWVALFSRNITKTRMQ